MRSFYEILNVDENATQEEILAAYRKRVLETHPDKGGDNIEFLNIKKGYDILSDSSRRAAYDKWLKEKRADKKKERDSDQTSQKRNNQSSKNTEEKDNNSNTRIIIVLTALILIIAAILYFKVDTSDQEKVETNYISLHTGDTPYEDYYQTITERNSLSALTFINYSSYDAVVIVVDQKDEVIRHTYISRNDSYTMEKIPEGKYIAKIMFGKRWNPDLDNGKGNPIGGFIDDLHYQAMKWNDCFDCIFENTTDGINYPTYSLTLHTIRNGNTQTKKIKANDFFN